MKQVISNIYIPVVHNNYLILVVLYWKMVRAWLAIYFIEAIPLCVNISNIYIYIYIYIPVVRNNCCLRREYIYYIYWHTTGWLR